MTELAAIIDSVDQHQEEVDDALHEAYALVDKAVVGMGKNKDGGAEFFRGYKS